MIIVNGDVFTTQFDAIAHQVNCQGVMNSGVAKTVRERYPEVFDAYKKLCNETPNPIDLLGKGQCVPTGHGDRVIYNIFGQFNYGYDGGMYTNYDMFVKGMTRAIGEHRLQLDIYDDVQLVIAIPYGIGCCRGGGDWDVMGMLLSGIETREHVVFVAYKL